MVNKVTYLMAAIPGSRVMGKKYNFCAGPAMLPAQVMEIAQSEFRNWNDLGVSVMEISHRSKDYIQMAEQAEQDLRSLMQIPDNYKVLFAQGGGRGQFAAVPLNLVGDKLAADYILTGQWSKSAVVEAQKYARINEIDILEKTADGKVTVKPVDQWQTNDNSAYVHYCPNETIEGIEINEIPDTQAPLVADMSSTILSRPMDVSKFGLIYAGAQKNIGPSGLALVIVREDLLGQARTATPSIFDYQVLANSGSMFNTPPTYSWYLAGLVFKWLKEQGGLSAMAEKNKAKASLLYQTIDGSDFYSNKVDDQYRSKMNVPFQLGDEALNEIFLTESAEAGLLTLKGHRIVGGMRASIYNAMPLEGVQVLVDFMAEFERKHG